MVHGASPYKAFPLNKELTNLNTSRSKNLDKVISFDISRIHNVLQ